MARERRKKRWRTQARVELTVAQILEWADSHYQRKGRWPIFDNRNRTWNSVDKALTHGFCGLPGGSSLAQLLAEKRGHRNRGQLDLLTEAQILAWVDDHFQRTHRWPHADSGAIPGTVGETWSTVNAALIDGRRGLPGSSSLAELLWRDRGIPRCRGLAGSLATPQLTEEQILQWVDEYQEGTGDWPTKSNEQVAEEINITWGGLDGALRLGLHGLPGGSSLAQLVADRRGKRNHLQLPRLTEEQILAWADRHFEAAQSWPKQSSGPIPDTNAETWAIVHDALQHGTRGLPGGSTLAQLLAEKRGVVHHLILPRLSEEQILAWADDHHQRTGRWPVVKSGPVLAAPDENWATINAALVVGNRGLPGGSSLAQLLARERGVRNKRDLPPLTIEQILGWADAHHQRTGKWPQDRSGQIADADEGQTWMSVDQALRAGRRGLPGGSSLPLLLKKHRRNTS